MTEYSDRVISEHVEHVRKQRNDAQPAPATVHTTEETAKRSNAERQRNAWRNDAQPAPAKPQPAAHTPPTNVVSPEDGPEAEARRRMIAHNRRADADVPTREKRHGDAMPFTVIR